jgi:hypothetical protein
MNFAILVGVVQAIAAITGSFVASKKFTYTQKWPFFWVFVGLAVVGLGLTIWQTFLTKRSNEDSLARQWDADHPPFVALISLPRRHRFLFVRGGCRGCVYAGTRGRGNHRQSARRHPFARRHPLWITVGDSEGS